MGITRVRLDAIVFDAGTQIRAAINEGVVADYADRMTDGIAFPPIILFHDGNQNYLADGFHRFMAAKRNDFRDITAEVRAGTKQDALWFALGANKENAHRLTDADKKHAIALAVETWPDRPAATIAAQIGCSPQWVSRVRPTSSTSGTSVVVRKNGTPYPARNPRAKSLEKRDEVVRLVKAGNMLVDDIAKAVGVSCDVVTSVRRELGLTGVDRSQSAVARRRKDIADMAQRGYTTHQIASAIGLTYDATSRIAKTEGIVVHADRVVGSAKRHDSTRIVETMVMDAENLTGDVNLIDFGALPQESLARWIDSLEASHKSLASFIRRLKKEQSRVQVA